jgi:hypothetical protein
LDIAILVVLALLILSLPFGLKVRRARIVELRSEVQALSDRFEEVVSGVERSAAATELAQQPAHGAQTLRAKGSWIRDTVKHLTVLDVFNEPAARHAMLRGTLTAWHSYGHPPYRPTLDKAERFPGPEHVVSSWDPTNPRLVILWGESSDLVGFSGSFEQIATFPGGMVRLKARPALHVRRKQARLPDWVQSLSPV